MDSFLIPPLSVPAPQMVEPNRESLEKDLREFKMVPLRSDGGTA